MPVTLIVGALFGDEGKGRVAHALAADADVVARFNGGANAAHTVFHRDEKLTLRQVPCGLLHGKPSLVGDGMALQLDDLAAELEELRARRVDVRNLVVSTRAHVVLPTHRALDRLAEERRKKGAVGTTLMGIGPALVDKVERTGLRVIDLFSRDIVKQKLALHAQEKSAQLGKRVNAAAMERDIMRAFARIERHVDDTWPLLQRALADGRHVLLEGAQGTFLDVDFGGYPFVTSTHPTTGGALASLGLAPQHLACIAGVTRTYTTRQSRGPLPTEVPVDEERMFRASTGDFAVRVGWLDLVLVKRAARINGFTELIVTGLDRLAGLPRVLLCTGYRVKGKRGGVVDDVPADYASRDITPEYELAVAPPAPSGVVRRWREVSPQAKALVDRIEEVVGVPVKRVSLSRAGPLIERGRTS